MYRFILFIAVSILLLGTITKCTPVKEGGIQVPDEAYDTLSEYGFFEGNIQELTPSEGVIPYDLSSALFSDYSHKERFVYMPDGQSAVFSYDHVMDFPIGATLIKNFYYYHDERDESKGRQLIETRLLINRGEEWDAYGYTWNEQQTDAVYDKVGDIKDVSWINSEGENVRVDYIIPNKNQCKGCHAYKNKLQPIGPKARNLNKDYAYHEGLKNQLVKWSEVGYLSGYDSEEEHPDVAVWDDENYTVHERAMAYLDINCGHCHNPDGAGNTSGLTLLAESELGLKLGIYKATVSAGAGTGGFQYSIIPGNPDESIMVYRMQSDNPGAMMPELGRRLVHEEGVELITDWIQQMDKDLTAK